MKQPVSSTQKMLNIWAIVLILWACYRTFFRTDLPVWFDEFVAKPAIFLIPVYYYITKYEQAHFWRALDLRKKGMKSQILFGLGAGILFFLTGMTVQFLKNGGSFGASPFSFSLLTMVYYVGISLASSFSEELLSRGFVLKRLFAESHNALSSVFFASFLFFFLHIPILFTDPNLYGNTLLQVMLTDLLLSFAVSLLYLQRKNVIVPILIHAFYNLSIYFFLGGS